MRTLLPFALLLLLPAAGFVSAQGDPRQEILRLLNAERQRAGAAPLRLSPELTRAADEHAAEVARRGSLRAGTTGEMRERLQRVGYEAHAWTESLTNSSGSLASVVDYWKRNDADTFREAMASEVRDVGIGLDRLDGMPLYIFLFAVPQADYFARGTAGVRDLGRVRAEMLARVNEARKRAGAATLRANAHLDEAAQRHAEDMLARGYFAHESPEGKTVRERARAAGYAWRAIGENIAEGQLTVDEVMDTWMHSPGHRRNILDGDFREMGAGVALGRSGGRYRILWVQTFGTR